MYDKLTGQNQKISMTNCFYLYKNRVAFSLLCLKAKLPALFYLFQLLTIFSSMFVVKRNNPGGFQK